MTINVPALLSDFDNEQLVKLVGSAEHYSQQVIAKNTRLYHEVSWKSFNTFCYQQNVDPLQIENKTGLVALYAVNQADSGKYRIGGLLKRIDGIIATYKDYGYIVKRTAEPLHSVLKGIKRKLPSRPVRKTPLLLNDLAAMIRAIPIEGNNCHRRKAIRDRAMLLLGFVGAFRRSEIVGLKYEDLTFSRNGITALIRRSKTDQIGQGIEKVIPYGSRPDTCPVRALQDWINEAEITYGYLFTDIDANGFISYEPLGPRYVAQIIKNNVYIQSLGADRFAGHSLRAGFVTEAAKKKIPESLIILQTGHTKTSALSDYVRAARSFEDSAACMIGL